MMQLINYFSSEYFKPKRLVYIVNPWTSGEGGKKNPPASPASRLSPEQRAEWEKREREYLEKARREEYKLRGEIEEKVAERLSETEAQEAITGYFSEQSGEEYKRGNWREWNKKYAEKMGYGNEREAKQKIKAMQRVIFAKLGLHGDPSAKVDGEIGPYTLAAMAAYAGKTSDVRVPDPERNAALADKLQSASPAEPAETASNGSPEESADRTAGAEESDGDLFKKREAAYRKLQEARREMEEEGATNAENYEKVRQAEQELAAIDAEVENTSPQDSEPAAPVYASSFYETEPADESYAAAYSAPEEEPVESVIPAELLARRQTAYQKLTEAERAREEATESNPAYEEAVQRAQDELSAIDAEIENAGAVESPNIS